MLASIKAPALAHAKGAEACRSFASQQLPESTPFKLAFHFFVH